jgi:hypothetical protein
MTESLADTGGEKVGDHAEVQAGEHLMRVRFVPGEPVHAQPSTIRVVYAEGATSEPCTSQATIRVVSAEPGPAHRMSCPKGTPTEPSVVYKPGRRMRIVNGFITYDEETTA